MGRLSDKLSQASDAIAALETATEHDVDRIIERTKELHAKREDVMLRKQTYLDGHMTDLTEFGKDLETFDGKNDHSGAGGRSSEMRTPYDGTTSKL